jgi:transglutaminase-like putative cysteine protease
MRLAVTHRITLQPEPEADRLALRLKLWPSGHAAQRVSEWTVTANGAAVEPVTRDAFGNRVGLWHARLRGEPVTLSATGIVETEDVAGIVRETGPRPPEAVFLRETPLTRTGAAVRAFAAAVPEGDTLGRLHALMHAAAATLAEDAAQPGLGRAAEDALEDGGASAIAALHLFIAASRALGIPARGVTGYRAGQGAPVLWAEAHVAGLGWVGFDPLAGMCPTAAWVRLGCGFDADDAAPIRSVPAATIAETVETDGEAQAQSQAQQ